MTPTHHVKLVINNIIIEVDFEIKIGDESLTDNFTSSSPLKLSQNETFRKLLYCVCKTGTDFAAMPVTSLEVTPIVP